MSKRVTGAFTFDTWEGDEVIRWDEAQAQRRKGAKTFTGEMTGTSVLEAIMCGVEGGPAVYVAIEKLDLEFHGMKGSFMLAHRSMAHGDDHRKSLDIVPGSGTGDFKGISGTAEILPGHDFVVDYDLES
ncbi:DUF3224 domain-containing protein [Streptomyces sp. NPDC052109]|uniref:DUF3224 domain-containing protein n=1 Tax=Streptomyces sp. NPDC052109 TaxID=3155527 RepID=UPI0034349056